MSGPARGTQPLGLPRSQARIVIREHLSVTNTHGLEEPLLSQRQRDEVPKFNQLRLSEMEVQAVPEIIGGECRIPRDRHRPFQGGALALVEPCRVLKVEDLVDLSLARTLLLSEYRPLSAAVLALDRFCDVQPAQLLDGVIRHALSKDTSQALLKAFITSGWCKRIAWLSGRGVPYTRARSMIA
jgi:hypothetical protein